MLLTAPLIKPVITGGSVPPTTLSISVSGNQGGSLPQGVTVFLAHETSQSEEFPIYIAQGNEMVTTFQMISLTGNGAAHTDVYTVVKNGVDTTMTFSVTNGSSGSTSSNQVSLVAGDRVAIKVATDAATAAADVIAQMIIQQS